MTSSGSVPLRLVVWAPESADPPSRLPTLDPDSLYAASLVQARGTHQHIDARREVISSARTVIDAPSPLIHGKLPCLEHGGTGVVLAEGIPGIEAYTQRWLTSRHARPSSLDESSSSTQPKITWARQHALEQYVLANLHPLVHQILFASDLYYSHTARIYTHGLSFLSRQALPSRIRRNMRQKYVSRGRWIDAQSGLGPILCDANNDAQLRNEEMQQREELARRAGISFNAAAKVRENEEKAAEKGRGKTGALASLGASRRVRDAAEQAGRAFGQLRILSFAEEVFMTLEKDLNQRESQFFSGSDKPSLVDLRLFSLLAPLLLPEKSFSALAASPLPRLLRSSFPRLVKHTDAVRQHIWPLPASDGQVNGYYGWPLLLGEGRDVQVETHSLSTRVISAAQSMPREAWTYLSRIYASNTTSSTRAKQDSSSASSLQRRDARRLQIGRYVWAASVVFGLIGTAFASGLVSIEMSGEDEENQSSASFAPPRGPPPPLTPEMIFERSNRQESRHERADAEDRTSAEAAAEEEDSIEIELADDDEAEELDEEEEDDFFDDDDDDDDDDG